MTVATPRAPTPPHSSRARACANRTPGQLCGCFPSPCCFSRCCSGAFDAVAVVADAKGCASATIRIPMMTTTSSWANDARANRENPTPRSHRSRADADVHEFLRVMRRAESRRAPGRWTRDAAFDPGTWRQLAVARELERRRRLRDNGEASTHRQPLVGLPDRLVRRASTFEELNKARVGPASRTALRSLPRCVVGSPRWFQFLRANGHIEVKIIDGSVRHVKDGAVAECAICTESFEDEDLALVLKCAHRVSRRVLARIGLKFTPRVPYVARRSRACPSSTDTTFSRVGAGGTCATTPRPRRAARRRERDAREQTPRHSSGAAHGRARSTPRARARNERSNQSTTL